MKRILRLVPVLILITAGCDTLHENFSGACWTTEDAKNETITMRCPDGSRATWDAPYGDGNCMITEDAEGVATIHCPDGSNAVLPRYQAPPASDGLPCTVTEGPGFETVLQCGAERAVLSASCGEGFPFTLSVTPSGIEPDSDSIDAAPPGSLLVFEELACDRTNSAVHFYGDVFTAMSHPAMQLKSAGKFGFVGVETDAPVDLDQLEALTKLSIWSSESFAVNFSVLTELGGLEAIDSDLSALKLPLIEHIQTLDVFYEARFGNSLSQLKSIGNLYWDSWTEEDPAEIFQNLERIDGEVLINYMDRFTELDSACRMADFLASFELEAAPVWQPDAEPACP